MKCVKCHAEIEQDAQFCPYCGTKVEHIRCCVKCGKPLDDDSDFCPYCGTRQNDVVVEPEQVEVVHSQEPELVQKELAPTPVVVEQPQEPEDKKVESEPPSSSAQEETVESVQPYESKPTSKKWLWIIGSILLLGVIVGIGIYGVSRSGQDADSKAAKDVEEDGKVSGEEGLISFEDALRIAEEMQVKDGDFIGFRSPDNVKNIMAKYGYKCEDKYFVEREYYFSPLYYKNCSFAKSSDNYYSGYPIESGNGNPSFVGIDRDGTLVIAPYSKSAFDAFMNQAKAFGAKLKENDESTIEYNFLSFSIIGLKQGVFLIKYGIIISKEDEI